MAKVFVEPIGVTVEAPQTRRCSTPSRPPPWRCPRLRRPRHVRQVPGAPRRRRAQPADRGRAAQKIPAERLGQGWRLACQAQPLSARVSIEVRGHRRPAADPHRVASCITARRSRRSHAGARGSSRQPALDRRALRPGAPLTRPCPAPRCRYHVLQTLPDVLRAARLAGLGDPLRPAHHRRRAAGRRRRPATASAVDIGTSKIVAYLFDLRRGEQHRPGGGREPADALRRGRDLAHRAGGRRDCGRSWPQAARDGVNETLRAAVSRGSTSSRATSTT